MTNTAYLFSAMKQFTDKRTAARETYLQTMAKYEGAKGTPFYDEQRERALKARTDAVESIKNATAEIVDNALRVIRKSIAGRGMTPPTDEQLRILQLLQMRKNVTPGELYAAALSMNGNGACLQVLQEMAQDTGAPCPNLLSMATDGLPAAAAERAVKDLQEYCRMELNRESAPTRAAILAAEHQQRINGTKFDPDELPQESPYESEKDFYSRILNMPLEVFAKTANE